jgi:GAF domain-containing protein
LTSTRPNPLTTITVVVAETSLTRIEKAARIAELVRVAGDYRWVGLYDVSATEIAAVAWTGRNAPAFPRFPVTQGLCGAAVSSRAAVIVGDVTQDPRYLTTFGGTRSEIVVPVVSAASAVLGLIDVESERLHAFADRDVAFLGSCASALLPLFSQER